MYRKKKIGVVVPAYNEEKQIGKVLETMPKFVDKIIVINDKSKDKTAKIVKQLAGKNKKIILIDHRENEGVGGAIASGYKWCRDKNIEVVAVMAGDGQMDPKDLPLILEPVVSGRADYSKANRLLTKTAYRKMPKLRYFGNSILSFLTKLSSGYWHVMDSQSGYTAINLKMLKLIEWDYTYKQYGQPNDLLVRLNIVNAKVCDVPLEPVYGVGEKSNMKISRVFWSIPVMLFSLFFWRLKEKYIIRDFHPLVLFYFFGFFSSIVSLLLLLRLLYYWSFDGAIPKVNFLAWMLSTTTAIQLILFAMWFDMDYNKDLKVA